jgi:hypothetical protein
MQRGTGRPAGNRARGPVIMQAMADTGSNGFVPPHRNGSMQTPDQPRGHAPWEFMILGLFVALMAILIIFGWIYFGSKSPERLPENEAAAIAAVCASTQATLKQLPNPFPKQGADRVARIEAENDLLDQMVKKIRAVPVAKATQADAVELWADDWDALINARDKYARDLNAAKGTDKRVRFVVPVARSVKPVTTTMDDFVRIQHPHLDACFTRALELETVEGERKYEKVTE